MQNDQADLRVRLVDGLLGRAAVVAGGRVFSVSDEALDSSVRRGTLHSTSAWAVADNGGWSVVTLEPVGTAATILVAAASVAAMAGAAMAGAMLVSGDGDGAQAADLNADEPLASGGLGFTWTTNRVCSRTADSRNPEVVRDKAESNVAWASVSRVLSRTQTRLNSALHSSSP